MRISRILYKSKILANGEHPVMIRVAHKGEKKYISTSTSCKANHWSKTLNLIGAKDPKREEKNKKITSIYLSLQNRLEEMTSLEITPSIELLLSKDPLKDKEKEKANFIDIFTKKAESSKAPRTQSEYRTFARVLESLYGDYLNVNDITQVFVNELRERIDKYYGNKNAQKNHFIKCFQGAYSFAEEIGAISNRRSIKFKNFKHDKKDKFLTTEEVTTILSAYKKDIVARSRVISEEEKQALSLFVLMMAFQGIANIDLAGVKIKDIEIKRPFHKF